MARNADTDLLPWIMGGLMGAMAVAVIVANPVGKLPPASALDPANLRGASLAAPAPRLIAVSMEPIAPVTPDSNNVAIGAAAAAANAAPATAIAPTTVTPLAPVVAPTIVQQSVRSELPPGQVWECTQNGQRTFSDSPCGDRPAIRQLSEVNRMAASPVSHAPHYLPPGMNYSGMGSGYAPDSYAPEDTEDPATDYANGVSYYPVAALPHRYYGHGQIAALQPPRQPPQSQTRSLQPRAIARTPMPRER